MLTQSAHEPLPPVDERLVLWIPIYDDGASVKGNIDMEIKSEHANSGRNPENDTTRSDSTSIDGTS
jgi:hypothetical protein